MGLGGLMEQVGDAALSAQGETTRFPFALSTPLAPHQFPPASLARCPQCRDPRAALPRNLVLATTQAPRHVAAPAHLVTTFWCRGKRAGGGAGYQALPCPPGSSTEFLPIQTHELQPNRAHLRRQHATAAHSHARRRCHASVRGGRHPVRTWAGPGCWCSNDLCPGEIRAPLFLCSSVTSLRVAGPGS